jgi:hypothetical protein
LQRQIENDTKDLQWFIWLRLVSPELQIACFP